MEINDGGPNLVSGRAGEECGGCDRVHSCSPYSSATLFGMNEVVSDERDSSEERED